MNIKIRCDNRRKGEMQYSQDLSFLLKRKIIKEWIVRWSFEDGETISKVDRAAKSIGINNLLNLTVSQVLDRIAAMNTEIDHLKSFALKIGRMHIRKQKKI